MWLSFPDQFKQDFQALIPCEKPALGSLAYDIKFNEPNAGDALCDFSIVSPTHYISLPSSHHRSVFRSVDLENIKQMYSKIYGIAVDTELDTSAAYCQYMIVRINNKVYGSFKSRSKTSSIIIAKLNNEERPARINFFAKHNAVVRGVTITHLLASLSWFQHHERQHDLGKPVTVWEPDIFCDPGVFSFIPVQLILCRTMLYLGKLDENSGNVLFISPYNI